MQCVYEAANGVEAHMIANLLEQHDIPTRIDGEYLTSGVGELPAAGLVRVMADERNVERARQIIREWEAASPADDSAAVARKRSFAPAWFLLGVLVTFGLMSLFARPRTPVPGIDYDGDGRLDERFTYTGNYVSRVEGDADRDGKVDSISNYDARGVPLAAELDTDFDGRFETKQRFDRGLVKSVDVDWDMDGHADRHEDYVHGVLSSVTYYAPDGYRMVKREFYDNGMLSRAEYDSDGDGVFDTNYRYDRYGEIIEAVR